MAEAEVDRAYADHVRALVDAAPPLTEEQRARIADLLVRPADAERTVVEPRRAHVRRSA